MNDTKATKECPHCFSEIDARATVCPVCNRDVAEVVLPQASEKKAGDIGTSLFVAFLVIIGTIALLAFLYLVLGSNTPPL